MRDVVAHRREVGIGSSSMHFRGAVMRLDVIQLLQPKVNREAEA